MRYERISPIFQSKIISREKGDALLAAMDGGGHILEPQDERGAGIGAYYQAGQKVICVLPVPPHIWLNIVLSNGQMYRLGIGDGFVDLPDGRYQLTEVSRSKIAGMVSQLDEDLRREVGSASKPCVYKVETVDDGGTLSGVARLFDGDAGKWRKIYEANRQAIKNPNVIAGGMRLIIPKLDLNE